MRRIAFDSLSTLRICASLSSPGSALIAAIFSLRCRTELSASPASH